MKRLTFLMLVLNFASGIYFYVLKAGNKYTAYKKMVLMK